MLLDYLPNLTCIDARGCEDYGALAELAKNRPECRVLYNVEIGGELWDQDTEKLILSGADPAELSRRLPALLKLKTVQLTEPLPGPEEIQTLAAQLPQVEFTWQVAFGENTYDGSARELALLHLQGTQELMEKLPYFPELERLDLRGGSCRRSGRRWNSSIPRWKFCGMWSSTAQRFPWTPRLWTFRGIPH